MFTYTRERLCCAMWHGRMIKKHEPSAVHILQRNNGGCFFFHFFSFSFWRVLHSPRFFTTGIMGNVARARDYVSPTPPPPPIVFEISWKRNAPAAFVQIIWVRNRRLTAYMYWRARAFYMTYSYVCAAAAVRSFIFRLYLYIFLCDVKRNIVRAWCNF